MDTNKNVDLELFLRNIDVLAKINDKKISEVEDAGGISRGYLSRLKKGTIQTVPSITLVSKIAEFFSITIDALVTYDYEQILYQDTNFLLEFIQSLANKTSERSIQWKTEWFEKENSYTVYYSKEHIGHPLFKECNDNGSSKAVYCSRFHENPQLILCDSINTNNRTFNKYGNVLCLKLDDDTYIYLTHIMPLPLNSDDMLIFSCFSSSYEMYLVKNGEVTGLCSYTTGPMNKSAFRDPLIKLYKSAEKSIQININAPQISEETKSILNKFINN